MRSASASSNAGQVHARRANSLPNISPRRVAPRSSQRDVSPRETQSLASRNLSSGRIAACLHNAKVKAHSFLETHKTVAKVLNITARVVAVASLAASVVFPPAALVAGIVSAATACLAPLYNIATEATSEEKTGKKAIALGLSFVGLATGLFSACIPFCGVISKGIKVAVSVLGSAFVGLGHAVRTALYKPTNADDPNVKDKKLAMKGQIAGSFMGAICAGIGTGLKEALKNLPLCSTFLALGKLLGAGLSLIGSATEVHRDGRLAAQAQAAKPQNGTDSETGANTLSEIGSATEVHRDSELAARTQAATPQNGTDLETGASALSGSETSETSVSDGSQSTSGSETSGTSASDGSQSTSGSETSGTSVSDESQSTSEYETSGTSASDESQSTSDRGNITLELSGERETPEGDGHQTDIAVGVPAQSYA